MKLIIIIEIIIIFIINIIEGKRCKNLKKLSLNEKLIEISNKFPSNREICKRFLGKFGNNKTKIEEKIFNDETMYKVKKDCIIIGNTYTSFTRIQTMIHECIHTVQDRKLVMFNYIFSNFYYIFYFLILGLKIFRKINNDLLVINIYFLISFVYYSVKIFLENDAMIRAEYLTKEYILKSKITISEMGLLIKEIRKINQIIIRATNFIIFKKILVKNLIFNLVSLILK